MRLRTGAEYASTVERADAAVGHRGESGGCDDQRHHRRAGVGPLRVAAPVLALALVGAAGCDTTATNPIGGSTPTAVPSGDATTAVPSASATSGATDPPSPTPANGPTSTGSNGAGGGGPAECDLDQLRVSLGGSDGAAGHYGIVLLFQNTGAQSCYLQGYPGVAGLDAKGNQVTQARRTNDGYLGGTHETDPARVVLASGESASALVEGTNVPRGDATSCPTYAGLLVTPPDETRSVRLTVSANGCNGLEIHPVVEGTQGTAPASGR